MSLDLAKKEEEKKARELLVISSVNNNPSFCLRAKIGSSERYNKLLSQIQYVWTNAHLKSISAFKCSVAGQWNEHLKAKMLLRWAFVHTISLLLNLAPLSAWQLNLHGNCNQQAVYSNYNQHGPICIKRIKLRLIEGSFRLVISASPMGTITFSLLLQ